MVRLDGNLVVSKKSLANCNGELEKLYFNYMTISNKSDFVCNSENLPDG